jgi:SAM-dependent methyltransferase
VGTAVRFWREALDSWAIPERILRAAPESPWGFPVELFADRGRSALDRLTPSNQQALLALGEGGAVLDVGCGGGAASLPLATQASVLVGVDRSTEMLAAFRESAERANASVRTIEGSWPEVADEAPDADVVVCHHVLYNAPDVEPFVRALTDHARRRVVAEVTARHPLSADNDLWLRFHGIVRPTRPTADDAVAVLRELGIEPGREDWETPGTGGFGRREDLVAWIRRRLCLPADRDPDVAEALEDRIVERDGRFGFGPRPVVTLWWEGTAG